MNKPVSGSVQATDCPYTELSSKEGTKSDKHALSLNFSMMVKVCRMFYTSPINDYIFDKEAIL